MAVLQGGIFSRPAGKTGGIVFGAARTRSGKLVTSRLLVSPSNPNTAAQQTQRSKFKTCQQLVRKLGPSCYQQDWNRSVGQLPGFQSMQSIFMNACTPIGTIDNLYTVNLGSLHFPDTFDFDSVSAGHPVFTWSTETGSNGTADDVLKVIGYAALSAYRPVTNGVWFDTTAKRSDGTVSLPLCISGQTYEFYYYFVGAGTAEGLISVAKPDEVDI